MTSYSYISPARKAVKELNDIFSNLQETPTIEITVFYISLIHQLASQLDTTNNLPSEVIKLIQNTHAQISQVFPSIQTPNLGELTPQDRNNVFKGHLRLNKSEQPQIRFFQQLSETLLFKNNLSFEETQTTLQRIQEQYSQPYLNPVIRSFLVHSLQDILQGKFNSGSQHLVPLDLQFSTITDLIQVHNGYQNQTAPAQKASLNASISATIQSIAQPKAFQDFITNNLDQNSKPPDQTTQEGPSELPGFLNDQSTATFTETPPNFPQINVGEFEFTEPTQIIDPTELLQNISKSAPTSEELIPESKPFMPVYHSKKPDN